MSTWRKAWRFLPALAVLGLLAVGVQEANSGRYGALLAWLLSLPHGDKLGHFALYGGLAAGLDWALRWRPVAARAAASARWRPGRWLARLPLGAAIALGLGVAEELSQFFHWGPGQRTPDATDLLANAVGVALCCGLGRWGLRRAAPSDTPLA